MNFTPYPSALSDGGFGQPLLQNKRSGNYTAALVSSKYMGLGFARIFPGRLCMNDVRALLLTDVVDSTKLSEALGDAQMAVLWAAHDRLARDLLPVLREVKCCAKNNVCHITSDQIMSDHIKSHHFISYCVI